jgi:hypothetical protein
MKTLQNNIFYLLLVFFGKSLIAPAQVVQSVEAPSAKSVSVYIVDDPYAADLLVYRVDNKAQSKGNRGWWYFQDALTYADKKIYFTNTPEEAVLYIYFVEEPRQAGWVNKKKKNYF